MADKVSFLKLPVTLDVGALRADLARIPSRAWQPSYWPYPHGSVDVILLRGGATDTEVDFYLSQVADRPLLQELPYIAGLVGPEGPFGGAHFAFLFRMRAAGVARLHRDAQPIWAHMYRVHIPIETNPGARLVVEQAVQAPEDETTFARTSGGRARRDALERSRTTRGEPSESRGGGTPPELKHRGQHFDAGEAWTFDNQALHGALNGGGIRTHLILDVPDANPEMAALRANAELHPGAPVEATDWARLV